MDCYTDPSIREIVLMVASQLGKSEVILNCIGYSIALDPGPILMVQPDEKNAKDFADERISTMIRDTPSLREKVVPSRGGDYEKNSGTFKKSFHGGYLAIASSNVPSGLAGKPIKKLFCDETDRYKKSSGVEGDPIDLAKKRTTTFWDATTVTASTPTISGSSNIEDRYSKSDQREYYVPCPHCGTMQTLKWRNVKWDTEEKDGRKRYIKESAHVQCEHCEANLYESDKYQMIPNGRWVAHADFNGVVGFKMSALYSPWFTWDQMVQEFLEVKDRPDRLKVFVNTRLGEAWVEDAEKVESGDLYNRRESYKAQVPMDGFVLTCGVDVQADRLEALVYAWGVGEEAWKIDHSVIWGDTTEKTVWKELDYYLDREYQHESGAKLRLSATGIDSGYNTKIVYDYCKGKTAQRIFATKGISGEGRPVISSPSAKRTGKDGRPVELFMVAADVAKEIIYGRLKRQDPGPGYFHFPNKSTQEFFDQLTAEKLVKRYERGFEKKVWEKMRARNEALDMTVIAYAVLKLMADGWENWKDKICGYKPDVPNPQAAASKPKQLRRVRSRGISL